MSVLDLPAWDEDAWDLRAPCASVDPETMTPNVAKLPELLAVAHGLCGNCPVLAQCDQRRQDVEADGLAPYGVWAGKWWPGIGIPATRWHGKVIDLLAIDPAAEKVPAQYLRSACVVA